MMYCIITVRFHLTASLNCVETETALDFEPVDAKLRFVFYFIRAALPRVHLCPMHSLDGRLRESRGAQKKNSGGDHAGRDRAACTPAFLQIRPGKADYSDPFPLSHSSVDDGREGDIFRLVWRCYLTLPFQHLGGDGGQRSHMTLLAFFSNCLASAVLSVMCKCCRNCLSINAKSSGWTTGMSL